MPSLYLNQWWNIIISNLRNKLQWNLQRNPYIFIQENALECPSAKWWHFFLGLNDLIPILGKIQAGTPRQRSFIVMIIQLLCHNDVQKSRRCYNSYFRKCSAVIMCCIWPDNYRVIINLTTVACDQSTTFTNPTMHPSHIPLNAPFKTELCIFLFWAIRIAGYGTGPLRDLGVGLFGNP